MTQPLTPDHRADLIADGLLFHTLYEKDGLWWTGELIARSLEEAEDKLRPGEILDGQVDTEFPDDGASDHGARNRKRLLAEVDAIVRADRMVEADQ